jgi:hypothetical protein
MADKTLHEIAYSKRSVANVRTIRDYLLYKFTQREVDNLYSMLGAFENVVVVIPKLYPLIINSKKIRRAVLSKQLSVFYIDSKDRISIVAILDNRMDNSKWPK